MDTIFQKSQPGYKMRRIPDDVNGCDNDIMVRNQLYMYFYTVVRGWLHIGL